MRRVLPLVLIVALPLAGCSKGNKSTPAAGTTPPSGSANAAAPTAAPATPSATTAPATPGTSASGRVGAEDPPPSAAFVKPVPTELPNVVAKVNGESVTKKEVEAALTVLEGQNHAPVPADQRDRVVRGIVDQMIGFKLLLQESKSRKVAVTDQEIDARMASIRQRFPTEDAFKSALASQKMTLDQVRTEQRQQLMINHLLESEIGPKSKVTPDEVAKVYKERPDLFQQPPQVHASHILITVPADADASVKAEALQKATRVLKDARAGKDFAALAKEFSQDPGTAAQGGDLGFFAANQMVPPFSDAAFKLKPGSISDIVETQFGYHIIKVIEKRAAGTVPLEQIRPQLEQQMMQEKGQREVQAFVQSLRQKSKVELFI